MNTIKNDIRFSKVAEYVKSSLTGYDSGHDWLHIERVINNSIYIWEHEKAGCFEIIVLGALLHDIGDRKFTNQDAKPAIRQLLESLNIKPDIIDSVIDINTNISFSSSDKEINKSTELMVVQDADRLDAIGAIGIARAFNYGGFKNRVIYDPDYNALPVGDMQAYRASCSPTINHFYEKLLLLRGMMNTPTGKILADERHKFMEKYLEQFYKEWNL